MEIEHCLLDWPKAIWFLVLTFCCSVAMETTYDVTQISSMKNESENSTSLWVINSTVVSDLNSTLEIETNSEDDDCLALESLSPEELECLLNLPSPPNIEDLPPPPLPPFLKEIELLLQQSNENFDIILQELESPRNDEQQEEIVPIFEDANCPLCQWSLGNNETLLLFKKDDEGESLESGSSIVMIWILIGVAILSATVGAFLTGIFFKCRRKNVISICSKSSPSDNTNSQDGGSDPNTKLGILRFSFRKMSICSKKSALDPYRAESIQNTYSESPYINTDSSSTMYAEITSPLHGVCGSSSLSGQPGSSDAYSEVPDPFNKTPTTSSQGIYCNSNYVTSEGSSEQNESSGGSTSTPSSAYYSDVSTSLEVHVNKRKKKKRKYEDKSLRLAPSQRLRKNYLPTSRSQQQHPCSSNERFLQNLRERNQNYYCTGNLVQNLMRKPRNDVNLADLGPSISREVLVPSNVTNVSHPQGCIVKENKGTLVNQVPLCLHFENVCTEPGHLANDIYSAETQAIENEFQEPQCCSKNISASLSQATDSIYSDSTYRLETLCSTSSGCSHNCDAAFPQQPQLADIYQDKTGCYRFKNQNQVPENNFPHAAVGCLGHSENKPCRCMVAENLCCSCCEKEIRKGNSVFFPPQGIVKGSGWNPSKRDLPTFHKHPTKDCTTGCDYNTLLADSQYVYTDGHINNGNIHFIKHNTTDPRHQLDEQTPNIYFGKNGKGENIYFTKANVCTPVLPHPQLSVEHTHPVQHTQQTTNIKNGDSPLVQQTKAVKQGQKNENFTPSPSEYI